jgi:hypothetical protein
VSCGLGHGAVLPPPGHAAVDQSRVFLQADLRAQPQALHDAGSVAFQQGIGTAYQLQDSSHTLRSFQVHADTAFAAIQEVQSRLLGIAEHTAPRALHPDDRRAHIRQGHGGEGARANAGDFNDGEALEWSHGGVS